MARKKGMRISLDSCLLPAPTVGSLLLLLLLNRNTFRPRRSPRPPRHHCTDWCPRRRPHIRRAQNRSTAPAGCSAYNNWLWPTRTSRGRRQRRRMWTRAAAPESYWIGVAAAKSPCLECHEKVTQWLSIDGRPIGRGTTEIGTRPKFSGH